LPELCQELNGIYQGELKMSLKALTITVMAIAIFGIILYDVFALCVLGVDFTISVLLNVWAFEAHPLLVFLLGMTAGGIIIHLFNWRPK